MARSAATLAFVALPILAACGPLMTTPDIDPSEPAARAVRLEELSRIDRVRDRLRTTERLVRHAQLAWGLAPQETTHVAHWIVDAATHYGLDPYLVAAVVLVESRFRPDAESYAGAVGLMQVLPYVGADVAERHGLAWNGWRTLRDPAANVRIGTAYLAELLARFDNDVTLALAAYNIGPTLLASRLQRGRRPNGPYVTKVMQAYRDLRQVAAAEATWTLAVQRRPQPQG